MTTEAVAVDDRDVVVAALDDDEHVHRSALTSPGWQAGCGRSATREARMSASAQTGAGATGV